MRSKVFFLILMLTASGILLAAADFGESSASLGQFTDDFEDSDNVSVAVNVVRNATLSAMELNATGMGEENFTTWTEVDPPGDLTVTASRVTFTTMRRDSNAYMVKDYGAGFFTDFEVQFKFVFTDVEAGDASGQSINFLFALVNTGTGAPGIFGGDAVAIELGQITNNDDQFKFRLIQNLGGVNQFAQFGANRGIGTFYITLDRSGTVLRLRIYSDAARTTLIETITDGTTETTPYRFAETTIGYTGGSDIADHSSGYVEFMDFGGDTEGYMTTTNYLDPALANGSGLVQLTNTSIPIGSTITAEFSQDNATWINLTPLTEGFQSIDLRDLNWSTSHYVRYNFTGTIGAIPRLYQSRLITTRGAVGPGAPGQNVTGEWILYNVTQFNASIGTIDAGNITSTYFLDGDTFNLSESVGPPGMIVSMNFTGIDQDAECLWLVINAFYDGNFNHDFDIQAYNFTSSAYVDIDHITDGTEFEWFNVSIYGLRVPIDFINGSGAVLWRLYHTAPGNINHDIFIDYIKLHAKIPSDVPVAGAIIVLNVESDFPWIAIAIILMCVAFLLCWNWKR